MPKDKRLIICCKSGQISDTLAVSYTHLDVYKRQELIDSDEFRRGKSKLTCVLGKDISGEIVVTDLSKLTHLLIEGTTGSGKSVCVNSILMLSLIHIS